MEKQSQCGIVLDVALTSAAVLCALIAAGDISSIVEAAGINPVMTGLQVVTAISAGIYLAKLIVWLIKSVATGGAARGQSEAESERH